MQRCDVLIVGGGPAGSSCAWALREAGLDVRLVDRAKFPRDKICAGWITPQVVSALQLDLGRYAGGGRVLQPISGFRIGVLGERAIELDFGETVSYGIRRCEFDEYLLRRSGAELDLGRGIRHLERGGAGWIVDGRVEARFIVGAGGHFCPVARQLGARPGKSEAAVLAQEVEFPLDVDQQAACPARGSHPELYFTPDLLGYGWVVRKGEHLNVGLGRQDPKGFPEHVDAFAERMERAGRLPPRWPREMKGHAYLLCSSASRPVTGERVLLAGDALGLAYDRSGEGIRPAVESGLLAARCLVRHGLRPEEVERGYRSEIARRLGRLAGGGTGASAGVAPPAWKCRVAARLLTLPPFARHVVINRWFLHRQQAALTRTYS